MPKFCFFFFAESQLFGLQSNMEAFEIPLRQDGTSFFEVSKMAFSLSWGPLNSWPQDATVALGRWPFEIPQRKFHESMMQMPCI